MTDDAKDAGLLAQVRRKLVESKEKWAGEGRLLTGKAGRPGIERLPPGQREVQNFPVLDLGVQPEVPRTAWKLTVDGLVAAPLAWSWDEFQSQPVFADVSDIHCVTAWSRFANRWEGVAARHLLGLVRPTAAARFVVFHGYDGYTTNVPLSAFDDDDVLLAHSWEGKPLSGEHGGPVRIVLPKLYFWKSAKWVNRIEFVEHDRPGFWELRGYHNTGDPWTEERYG